MITNLAKKKKRGFTLVEVIIVLAIIAIIAAIAIPNLTKVRTESKIKADTQSAESIRKTTIMLLTDDTLKVTSTGFQMSFGYNSGKVTGINAKAFNGELANIVNEKDEIVLPGTGGDLKTLGFISDVSGKNHAEVVKYFEGIKQPQSDNAINYLITVTNSGEVIVDVAATTGTGEKASTTSIIRVK